MKIKLLLISVLVGAITAFAGGEQAEVRGWLADDVLESLNRAGAYSDCGMGKCATAASEVTCSQTGNEEVKCYMNLADSKGGQTSVFFGESQAMRLFASFKQAGVVHCKKQVCSVYSPVVRCGYRINSQNGDGSTWCSIQ